MEKLEARYEFVHSSKFGWYETARQRRSLVGDECQISSPSECSDPRSITSLDLCSPPSKVIVREFGLDYGAWVIENNSRKRDSWSEIIQK